VAGEPPAVHEDDRHVHLLRPHGRVDGGDDAAAQRHDGRIAHRAVAELPLAGGALDQRDGDGVVHAELPLQPRLRRLLPGQLQDERVHAQLDAIDPGGREPVLAPELDGRRSAPPRHAACRARRLPQRRRLRAA